ncbi:MAG: hypothetical protein ABIQ93_15395 [Saprospiraceae bacterium]
MSHPIRLAGLLALALLALYACEKDSGPKPSPEAPFIVHIDNEFNDLQAQYSVFLSDGDGKTLAYRQLAGSDTAQLQVPNSKATDRLDCTIVRLTTLEAQGSGVTDTTLSLRTYTQLASGQTIHLRSLVYQQSTDLQINLTNLTDLDTILVPDALPFVRPQASNNFSGLYHVVHTGSFWLRLKAHGDLFWRYLFFDHVTDNTLEATVNVSLLPSLTAAPKNLVMPFTAPWQYRIDGVVDTAARQYLALGDQFRAPGGANPAFGDLNVFEPAVQVYNGYRIVVKGSSIAPGGYTYASDGYYATLPGSLPLPNFDLEPTTATSNRYVGVKCVGNFDLLALTRSRSGNPNINWEVLIQPVSGILTYRLPDVPTELGQRFTALKNFELGNSVAVRAENYERIEGYEAVLRQLLRNDDPFWQAKAGYLGREEVQ